MLSVLQFEVEASLGPQNHQKLLGYGLCLVQGHLKVPEYRGQNHPLLIQSKLLPYAVPMTTAT